MKRAGFVFWSRSNCVRLDVRLVTILEEEPAERPNETALLSEASLAEDWNRPEEDAAWSYLRPVGPS